MSQTPEAPLLSPERLEQIKDRVDAHERVHIAVVAIRYGEDVPALLADRAAYRQQVAEQLGRLLYLPQIIAEMEPNAARSARYQNLLTTAAATRLGIELPR